MNIYKNLKIRYKLLIIFLIQAITLISLFSVYFYYKSNEIMENHAVSVSEDILTIVDKNINDYMQRIELASWDLLYDQVIYDALSHRKKC